MTPLRAKSTTPRRKIGARLTKVLYASINQFQWREVSLVLLDVFVVVVISEFISATYANG